MNVGEAMKKTTLETRHEKLNNESRIDGQSSEVDGYYIDLARLSSMLSLSSRTIRSYINQPDNPLPTYKIGRKFLFSWAEVEAWIQIYKVKIINTDVMVEDLINDISKESI